MKKHSLIIAAVGLFLSFSATAQTQKVKIKTKAADQPMAAAAPAASASPDYFVGKWDVLVQGTPSGDGKMLLTLDRKDGKLEGTMVSKPNTPAEPVSKVEEKGNEVKVYFKGGDYDVNMTLTKKDDDHANGDVLGMFDAKATRLK